MSEIMTAAQNANDKRTRTSPRGNARGFSLAEMLIVLTVGTILTIMVVPSVNSGLRNYRIDGAISSITWAIHSTRYQALMSGYPYQVAFTGSANAYQIQNSPPANNGTYSNVGTSVPFSSYPVVLSADTTLNFRPNGYVTATTGVLNFTITYQGVCQRLTVTNYGNVSISPNYPQPTC
jgi:prepilin-type N-terminal cleavage/methylation domain-containing protein